MAARGQVLFAKVHPTHGRPDAELLDIDRVLRVRHGLPRALVDAPVERRARLFVADMDPDIIVRRAGDVGRVAEDEPDAGMVASTTPASRLIWSHFPSETTSLEPSAGAGL